ncbi:Metallo-dependent phosphatase-like protein [Cokeromyces recurvatus]|uniref:Metallo-dependent phosphatase-like protein n=1 Tax=Cokeromyces recurvatus TaxID=90255 RepID=UPI00221EF04B|nr:Metallo-dependent phosphatase-like protein [Cokeromyces recurvatus]KAI7901589.1 Metallo-dependent phosphatase-like protein [Cokeromyces recurvatus]
MKAINLFYLPAFLSLVGSIIALPEYQQQQQQVFSIDHDNRKLHGRYLHITDIHMDKNYVVGATIKSDCHRKPKKHRNRKKKEGLLAGYWGAPVTDCDSPPRLVYHSINTIAKEWKDKIDFIIWTGDNARTKKEIIGYNVKVTELLKQAFKLDHSNNQTIPIIPCIGNNDIHPHNELRGMKKNPQLLEFSEIWHDFIPAEHVKAFKRGGYFAVDVVPGLLRVISLNTLYFFGSNDVVNACSDPKSAGAQHMRWLRSQLKKARKEDMKVILIGHVPPTVKTFKDSCLDDYIQLSTKYADIITAHMYGHSNIDHFQIIGKDFMESTDAGRFISTLHEQYKRAQMTKNRKDLVAIHVAPPMLPLFYPSFRINEYDTKTGHWLKYSQWYTNLTYWNEQQEKKEEEEEEVLPGFEKLYATDETYNMTDLTVDSWLNFAEYISSKEGKELWKTYSSNMFVKTNNEWYGQSVPTADINPPSHWWNWF